MGAFTDSYAELKDGSLAREIDIAFAEALAFEKGVQVASRYKACITYVFCDSTAAGKDVEKAYSPVDSIDEVIKRIYSTAQETSMTIIVVDTPSAENIADIDTRPERLVARLEEIGRKEASLKRLQSAAQHWLDTGKTYFQRTVSQ